MKSKISYYSMLLIIILYVTNVLLLFFIKESFLHGHMIPGVLGLLTSLGGAFITSFKLSHTWKNKIYNIFIPLIAIFLLNFVVIIFSILDIVGNGNHVVTASFYVFSPLATLISCALIKI